MGHIWKGSNKQQMYGHFEGFPLYSDDSAFFVGPIGHRTGQDID